MRHYGSWRPSPKWAATWSLTLLFSCKYLSSTSSARITGWAMFYRQALVYTKCRWKLSTRRRVFEIRTYPYPTRCPSINNNKALRFHRVCFHVKPKLNSLQKNADTNMHGNFCPTVLLFSAVTTSGLVIAASPEKLELFKQEYKSQYYHKLLDRMFLKDW